MSPVTTLLIWNNLFYLVLANNINAIYVPNRDVLSVHFDVNNSDFSSYKIELFSQDCHNGTAIQKAIFLPEYYPHVDFGGPFATGEYCIMVSPLKIPGVRKCRGLCDPLHKRMSITESDKLDCTQWNATASIIPDGNLKQVQFKVKVWPKFEKCFESLRVSLRTDAVRGCDDVLTGREMDTMQIDTFPDSPSEVVFRDLNPGNYCVRITASHPSCGVLCSPRFTPIFQLVDQPPHVLHVATPPEDNGSTPTWVYVLSSCMVIVVSGIVVVIILCRRRTSPTFIPVISFQDPTIEELNGFAKKKLGNMEIVLLYTRDCPEHVHVVTTLYHFLVDVLGFSKVRFDEEENAKIFINLESWIDDVIEPQDNRKFLIVESQGGVLQEEARKKTKVLRPVDECLFDDVFPKALLHLKNDERAVSDYENVFVIRFGYTPNNCRLNSVVRRYRYEFPKHLFDLYCALLQLPQTSLNTRKKFEDSLKKKWQEQPLYQQLLSGISDVFTELKRDPYKITKSMTEQNLLTAVY